MSHPKWQDCFDYIIRYGSFGGHPPFLSHTRLNKYLYRTHFFMNSAVGIRMILTIIHLERGSFLGIMFLIYSTSVFVRSIDLQVKREKYEKYLREVDDFLRWNENNPITNRRNHFMEIWNKQRPQKLSLTLLLLFTVMNLIWFCITVYGVAAELESSKPLYYSPHFYESETSKWLWTLHEIFPSYSMIYLSWYMNMSFTSLIKFQYCQLLYVKELAMATMKDGGWKDTDYNMAWWIKVHQQVLGMTYSVKNLLQLQILSTYFTQMLFLIFSLSLTLFENATQTDSQKILCTILGISHIVEFGYNCTIVDNWESVQNTLRDAIFTRKTMFGNKWRIAAYKMFILRADKPLIFSVYHFVVLNLPTYRKMMMNIFSVYMSFRSIVQSRSNALQK